MSTFKTVLQPVVLSSQRSLPLTDAHECEFVLNIGLFFDGTGNNKNSKEESESANTNVARLWQAYRNAPDKGYFGYYVSGVGTAFSELEEANFPGTGGPFGRGGEARIIYGLLQVINSIHGFINGAPRFTTKQLTALCSETRVPPEPSEGSAMRQFNAQQKILDDLGLSQGLVSASDRQREQFFARIAAELRQKVKNRSTLPKVKSIYIDVFGFSRGAAQARVFVSWLHELLLIDGYLCGAASSVRMLGLFDTVASVGLNGTIASGHSGWASAQSLRIPLKVGSCVHIVAMHELRSSFPSDSLAQGDELPSNCQEFHCPGVHSDVGGGYGAGEQGKAIREELNSDQDPRSGTLLVPDDQLKLAMLPLNQMYAAARQATQGHESPPWIALDSKAAIGGGLPARFGLDRLAVVRQSVEQYFALCGVPEGLHTYDALRQHGLRYLAWRYQVNQQSRFETLPSVQRAIATDPEGLKYYRKGQKIFADQVRLLSNPSQLVDSNGERAKRADLNPHAPDIFNEMKALKVDSGLGTFFDEWVHDSVAGFIEKFVKNDAGWWESFTGGITYAMAESQHYVRWRGAYAGDDVSLNAGLTRNWEPDANQQRAT